MHYIFADLNDRLDEGRLSATLRVVSNDPSNIHNQNIPFDPATMILHLPIAFPRCVKGLRLGILMLGMISCGALSCTIDDTGSSSSLDKTAWLLLSPAPEDALDRGRDWEERVSGLLGREGS